MIDAVIVLGNKNHPDGTLTPITRARVEKAIAVFRHAKARYLITTGGKGRFFNRSSKDHCEHTRDFAIRQGIRKTHVRALICSKNTVDEILGIRHLVRLNKWKGIIIVSSASHMPRIRLLCMLARIETHVGFEPTSEKVPFKEALREMAKTPPSIMFLLRRRKEDMTYLLSRYRA